MEKLNKSQRKKAINEALKDFFKKEKMQKYDVWDNGYGIKKDINEGDVYIGLLSFMTSFQEVSYSNTIHIKNVEDIIAYIEFPDYDWIAHKSKNSLLPTIQLCYFEDSDTKKKLSRSGLDWSEKDCVHFANNIIEYYESKVSPLFDYYCYLPNILKGMDKLESDGRYWYEILGGGGDHLFRGLIISKLCNDNKYDEKEKFVYKLFCDQIDSWAPYCDKLIAYLKGVDPIYNI